eukprot:3669301-Alexandrium_andersonii.AAC.1
MPIDLDLRVPASETDAAGELLVNGGLDMQTSFCLAAWISRQWGDGQAWQCVNLYECTTVGSA